MRNKTRFKSVQHSTCLFLNSLKKWQQWVLDVRRKWHLYQTFEADAWRLSYEKSRLFVSFENNLQVRLAERSFYLFWLAGHNVTCRKRITEENFLRAIFKVIHHLGYLSLPVPVRHRLFLTATPIVTRISWHSGGGATPLDFFCSCPFRVWDNIWMSKKHICSEDTFSFTLVRSDF